MIPDDNPGQSVYMTLKDIRRILTDCYGKETGNPMPAHEIDQVIGALAAGNSIELCEAGMYLVPAEAKGLYCAYQRKVKEHDDE